MVERLFSTLLDGLPAGTVVVMSNRLDDIEDGTGPWIEKGYPTSYGADA